MVALQYFLVHTFFIVPVNEEKVTLRKVLFCFVTKFDDMLDPKRI